MRIRALALLVALSMSCALPAQWNGRSTAQLTTPGIMALHSLEVVKVLDVARDFAIDAEAGKILSTDDARRVVMAHRSALLIIHEAPGGWKNTVLKALDELQKNLSPSARQLVGPYLDSAVLLIKAVL